MADDAAGGGTNRGSRFAWRLVAIAVVLACYAALKLLWQASPELPPELGNPADRTFDGESSALERTVVVPTLDTPIPKGKNVIWCSSFQVAWNHLRDDVIGEPIRVANAEAVAERLNKATQSEADLAPGSYYAAAGYVRDGIVGRIQREMARRFPGGHRPDFSDVRQDTVIVAYAYLLGHVRFTIPFFDNPGHLSFWSMVAPVVDVHSFGLGEEHAYAYRGLRRQVSVLYTPDERESLEGQVIKPKEFVVDPCKDSSPNQIVLALLEPRTTLAETLACVEARVREGHGEHCLGPNDVLLIPNMAWRVEHRFRELEGSDKVILNRKAEGTYIQKAWQVVLFRLDRSGAELESEAKVLMTPAPSLYIFDRPFLVYMKKRGAQHPFFVMWVANAELLSKWK